MTIDYKNIKAWPFLEAIKIKKKLNNKKTVNFETGYGPSGIPHIGTFAEVLRTNMVRNCLLALGEFNTNIIAFSDDMDALKKVPDDYPFPEKLKNYIGYPLSSVPDFTNQHGSYADKNNFLLQDFLNRFGFKYQFESSSLNYKAGKFDKELLKICENYESIMELVLPTLRKERRESYSPFLPICSKTGKVLEVATKVIDKKEGIISYKDENNIYQDTLVTGGNCKLQWKVDWAMRWSSLNIDYEMNGKDLIPSFELSKRIAKYINNKIPINMSYELFLDQNGEKISKSKGNGLTIEEWVRYGSIDSLSLFMYQNPKRAKRLYFDCIPRSMDEFKKHTEEINDLENDKNYDNPVWHVKEGKVNKKTYPIEFSTLLSLVTALNTNDREIIKNFVKIYIKKDLALEEEKELDKIINLSIAYFQDFILPTLKKEKPNEIQKGIIKKIIKDIENITGELTAENYQNLIYKYGKELYPDNLREWFIVLYRILFGSSNGPRLGSFFSAHKKEEVLKKLNKAIK